MTFLKLIQIAIAISLIIVILLQNKGAGLGSMFGGGNNVYLAKRGLDKILFVVTIVLVVLFFAVSLAAALI
ncbi:preprotein translocase subunit SecG [Candidatus Falkowbacteria bacterium]|nr:preprotein translocase subunit SecG [Candidatus Falkowbacteria bacterium]